MKKGIIVLLIAVLAAGLAFADFTGSATIGYDFDLDYKNHGIFNEQKMSYKFKFEFDTAKGESKGEGDLYAEIAATADFVLEAKSTATGEVTPKATLKITKANIVIKDAVTINILGPKGAFNYAKSYYVKNAKGAAKYDFANNYEIKNNGFVASYEGFSLAFSYRHTEYTPAVDPVYGWVENELDPAIPPVWGVINTPSAADTSVRDNLYVGLETKSFEIADGLTAQAGANFKLDRKDDNSTKRAGATAKVAYKNEDAKLSASFAVDGEYKSGEVLPIDMLATATYDFITANVYFGTEDKFAEGKNVLSAGVKAAYDINESISVSGYCEVRDIIKKDQPDFLFGAEVDYTAEKFSAYAGLDASMKYSGADEAYKFARTLADTGTYVLPGFGLHAGISTTALINNCTVALDWSDSDFMKVGDEFYALGVIKLSATVSF